MADQQHGTTDALTDRLASILAFVDGHVRFAEGKNGALLAFNGATLLTLERPARPCDLGIVRLDALTRERKIQAVFMLWCQAVDRAGMITTCAGAGIHAST